MNSKEYVPAVIIGLLCVGTPLIPVMVLRLLDSVIVNVLIVAGLLLAISYGPVTGVLALVLAGLLYMERNRYKVSNARVKFEKIMEAKKDKDAMATVEEAEKPQETVPVVEFDEPQSDDMSYLPLKATGSDHFERVPFSENLDDKAPNPTVPIGAKSAPIFKDYLH
jgi:hypothetical protein